MSIKKFFNARKRRCKICDLYKFLSCVTCCIITLYFFKRKTIWLTQMEHNYLNHSSWCREPKREHRNWERGQGVGLIPVLVPHDCGETLDLVRGGGSLKCKHCQNRYCQYSRFGDAKRTPFYSSDLYFLGIIMQLSELWWHFRSDLPKSKICNIRGVQYVQKISSTDIGPRTVIYWLLLTSGNLSDLTWNLDFFNEIIYWIKRET